MLSSRSRNVGNGLNGGLVDEVEKLLLLPCRERVLEEAKDSLERRASRDFTPSWSTTAEHVFDPSVRRTSAQNPKFRVIGHSGK
jgi:hypothetical protein